MISVVFLKEKSDGLLIFYLFPFKDESSITKLSKTPPTTKFPDSPERPTYLREAGKKPAVTPLDINRFQSKAFQAVISHHIGKATTSPPPRGLLQKEPSLHLDTPSKFLSKDKLFKPSFDVKVMFFAKFCVDRGVEFKDRHKLKNSTKMLS